MRMKSCREEKANEQTGKNADAATQKKDKRSKSKGKKFDKNACLLVFVLIFSGNPDFSSVDSE